MGISARARPLPKPRMSRGSVYHLCVDGFKVCGGIVLGNILPRLPDGDRAGLPTLHDYAAPP